MKKEELIKRLRIHLYDKEGKIFKDHELEIFLDKSAEAYSRDSEIYRSGFYFCTDAEGRCRLPQDYIKLLTGWGIGYQLEKMTEDELQRYYSDYRDVKGKPEFVYEETESSGKIKICPNPHDLQGVKSRIVKGYGLPVSGGRGVFRQSKDYGIATGYRSFLRVGDCFYIRKENCEKISDYMALLFYALYQAYRAESDFHDENKSEYYHALYLNRVGMTSLNKSGMRGKRCCFY